MSKEMKRLNHMVSKLVENVRELREIVRNICKHNFTLVKVCRYGYFDYKKQIPLKTVDIDYICSICKKKISRILKDHCKAELDCLLKLGLMTMDEYVAVLSEGKDEKIMTTSEAIAAIKEKN